MSRRHATEFQGASPSLPLPPDHVLNSGAVVFPGAFDQHGCPLVMFPVDSHGSLSDLSKSEVVDFIHYFLCLYNKKQEKESLVSVVADLRLATLNTTRFIAETLLLLELHRRTMHTVYILQPKKKEVLKLLLKLLVPSKSYVAPFKRVLLKGVFDLSNYIDRSQLTASLGGYLVYCHQSWVTFIKEIDGFVQEFLSVVQRLPSSISTLQTLSRQPVPSAFTELKAFCYTNEAKFQMLRRELGLDKLLRHCECVVEKMRYPEKDSCYQAMAGTALFTHTAFDMLQNYSRITVAVEKIELLWQQAFSKAHLQLQVFQMRNKAQQITEQIKSLQKEKLQPYRIEIAKDARRAEMLTSEFEASIYTPAMALVRCSEDVIHTLAEILPPGDAQTREEWVQALDRLKENFHSAVELPHQTLRAVSDFYHYYKKANSWYNVVLCENFLQDLLWGVNYDRLPRRRHPLEMHGPLPVWRQAVCDFLKNNPSPDMEELVQLAHLANVIPDAQLQQTGKRLSRRCMNLCKLLTCPGAVPINDLQLALQWQYEFLRASHREGPGPHTNLAVGRVPEASLNIPDVTFSHSRTSGSRSNCHTKDNMHSHGSLSNLKHHQAPLGTSPSSAVSGAVSAVGKPPSLSSFDSGFDGAGSGHMETGAGREGWEGLSRVPGTRDSFRPITRQPQIHEENISSVSDSEDRREEFDFGSVGSTSRASIQIIPKITVDSMHFEIKLKRSATLPQNPWLSLPVEDLENSYTVTITQNPSQSPQLRHVKSPNPSECSHHSDRLSNWSRDQPTQTAVQTNPQSRGAQPSDSILQAQDSFDDSELSAIRDPLSSTITDAGDGPNYTAESSPTLLWDTYDFHNPKQDSCERITSSMTEVSLNDWDLKEQEGLRKVEEILDRAAGILEEEENVMVQEQMLAVLLKTESTSKPWESWGSEAQMSSSDLKAHGVLGLDDSLASADTDNQSECRSPEATSKTVASEHCMGHNGQLTETGLTGLMCHQSSRGELLKELRGLHVLDELIMEENLKIHQLRRAEKQCLDEKPTQSVVSQSTGKERQEFLLELEREKREVERMENSLDKEMPKECQLKRMSRTRKVVKCSVMERTSKLNLEDSVLCDTLISDNRSQHHNVKHLPSLPQDSINLDPIESLSITATPCPDYAKSPVSQTCVQSVNGQSPHADANISGCGDAMVEVDTPSHCDLTEHNAPSVLTPPQITSDPNESIEEVGLQSHEGTEKKDLRSGEAVQSCTPETTSFIPEMCPEHGAFEPGANANYPAVPKPRKASVPVNDKGQELKIPTESMYRTLCPDNDSDPNPRLTPQVVLNTHPKPQERRLKPTNSSPSPVLSPDVNEHRSNNNDKPFADQQASLCNNPLEFHEQSTLGGLSVGSTLTLVDSDCVQIEIHCSHKSEDVLTHLGSNSEELSCMSAEVTSGSCEPSGADEWSEVEVPDGFQRCGTARRSQANHHIPARDMTNFKTPIVLDTGSGLMKAGFADQDLPNTIFPNIIGLPKYEEIMNGCLEREAYIGHEAQHMRGVLALKYPMKNGIIRNWDEMEKIWHHTFQQLHVEPDDHPVLLTEAAMNPLENRQRMVELMFECFNVPLTYVAMQAVLALYAAGRTTGVVFDSGDGVSHSVPVFEGYCLPHAVQRFTLAGHDVTMHLKKLLQEQGFCMSTSAEMEIVREMKEKCCRVSQDYESELTCGGSASSEMYYTMPDGQVVHLGTERFRAPEILFKPELIGRDHYGMHESIFKSILSSDIDLRRSFLANIVLSGGNTLLDGLPERLQSEIITMVPTDMGECVRVTSPKDRDFSVWSGGAVLANLSSFASAWISQEEYEEYGPQIVFRKCF